MKVCKKLLLNIVVLGGMALPLFPQSSVVIRRPTGTEYWFIMKQAEDSYEAGSYGQAISLAEEAKSRRREQTAWEAYVLDQSQRIRAVRKAGDLLDDLIPVLEERNQASALEVIGSYLENYGPSFFGGRLSRLQDYLGRNDQYPEADYLIGKVYKVEGETGLATRYMEKAYEAADLLNVPDVKFDILYDLAELAENQLDSVDFASYVGGRSRSRPGAASYYTEYEKYMLAILSFDGAYTNEVYMDAVLHLVTSDTKDAVGKFFMLYRSDSDISLKALEGLTVYYNRTAEALAAPALARQEREKALRCAALGSIIALTKIQDIVDDRLTAYSYTGLEDLLVKASKYSDVVYWGNENGIWELYYDFAQTCADCGYTDFARSLLDILSRGEPVDYWRQKAASHALLREPAVVTASVRVIRDDELLSARQR